MTPRSLLARSLGAAIAAAATHPLLAAAAEGGGESATFLGLPRWIWLWLNLLLFLGILGYFLVPGIKQFLETRSREIRDSLERARTQEHEARRMEADLGGQLAALRREMDELIRRTEADAERERAEILAQAERERERLLQQTQQEVALRVAQAKKELQRHAAELAANLARERIVRDVEPATLERLFDQSVERLERDDR